MWIYHFLTYEKIASLMVALVVTGLITNFGGGIIPDAVADSEQLWRWLLVGTFLVTYLLIKLVQWRVRRSEERRRQRR